MDRKGVIEMNKMPRHIGAALLLACALLIPAALPNWAADGGADGVADGGAVELVITLPEGADGQVAYRPGIGQVMLVLPQGSSFPMDVRETTGGLIHNGRVDAMDDGTMGLTLELASGTVQEVRFAAGQVIVSVSQRFDDDMLNELGEDTRYTLGAYDRLMLTIYDHPDLSGEISVSREGRITAPFIGEVIAAGKTTRELAEELTVRLGREYLVNPEIDVSVEKFRSQWVMVNGEVRNPGRIFLTGGTTLKEAISDANGFVETSGDEILISRENDEGTDMMRINRLAFENGEVNPVVQHGDIVTVKPIEFVYLQGEVRTPRQVPLQRGLTLMQSISMANGLTEWANRRSVKILSGKGGEPQVIDIKDIERGKMPDPELKGGDVIVITRRFF